MNHRRLQFETKFTNRQRVFIVEYQRDFNATAAAMRAGYSSKTANEQAARLLTKANVKRAIEAGVEARLRAAGVTAEKVLIELARIALHDIRKLYDENGALKLPHEWDDETAAAVVGLEVFEEFERKGEERKQVGQTRKVKVFSKVEALSKLGEHLKLFAKQVELTGKDGGPILTKAVDLTDDELLNIARGRSSGASEKKTSA